MELDFSTDTIERLLFKKSLVDKNWLNILANTYDRRWFKNQSIGIMLNLVIRYYNKYSSIPSSQVIQALVKKYSEKNPDAMKASEAQELLADVGRLELQMPDDVLNTNLKGFIRKNALAMSLYDNAELLTRDSEAFDSVVDKCLENFDRVQKITFNDTDLGLNYFDPAAMAKHWEFINNPEAKVKTGWVALDQYTNGGLLKDGKMLCLFMAQAGLGKSVFMSNLAVNLMRQDLSVVVISLEMSQDVYAQRFDAHLSKKNINRLKENADTAIERIKAFYENHPKANLYVKEYPPRSIKSKDIQIYLENLQNAGHHFDAVIVDYLNLVLPNTKSDSMYKDGLTVSEELRALSYQFKCPFISAVQSNSEGIGNAEIDMQNVSESRGIVHTTDCLFAMYQSPEDREHGIINMRVLKNRLGGMVGKLANFTLDPESLILEDVTFSDNSDIPTDDDDSEIGRLMSSMPNLNEELNNSSVEDL